ncbi:MAG: preprotein translocase subunit SecE [Anaerolineales bacterium]
MAERRKQNPIQRVIRETVAEIRRVSWPTREEATYLTILVLITMIGVGTVLALVEALSLQIMNNFLFR